MPSTVYQELGRTYTRLSDPRHALEAFERGRSLESDPDLLEELSSSLDLDCPLVHGDLCAASRNVMGNFLRRGQHVEADAICRVATTELGCAAGLLN